MVAKAAGNTNTNTFNFGDIAWDSWSGGGGGGGISWGTGSVWGDTSSNWNMNSSLLSNSAPDLSFNNNADGLLCTTPQTADYASPTAHFNSDQLITANGYDFHSVTGSGPDTTPTSTTPKLNQVNGLPVTDLSGVTVTASPQAPAQTGQGTDSEMDAAAAYTGLTGSILDGGALVAEHGPYGISLDWSKPAGYDALLVGQGGRVPSYVARPALEGVNISTDAAALREADYVLNLGKAAPWLKTGGNMLGSIGIGLEWTTAIQSHDPRQVVHATTDTGVFGASLLLGGFPGLALGTVWTLLDTVVRHEHYKGMQGWPAALTRRGDNINHRHEILRKNSSSFMFLGDK